MHNSLMNKKAISVLLLAMLSLTGCATPRQYELDAQVDRLCALDGETRVYETITLPAAPSGKPEMLVLYWSSKGSDAIGPEYGVTEKLEILKGTRISEDETSASIKRLTIEVYRKSDMKVLGSSRTYIRSGGDLPWVRPATAHSCPTVGSEFFTKIFLKTA